MPGVKDSEEIGCFNSHMDWKLSKLNLSCNCALLLTTILSFFGTCFIWAHNIWYLISANISLIFIFIVTSKMFQMRTEAANNKNNNVICSKHHSHPPPVPNHRTHQCTPDNRKQTPQRCNSVCSSSGSTSSSSGPGRLRRLLSLGSPRTRLETAFVPSSSSTPPPTSSSSGGSPAASLGRPPSAPPSFTSRSSPAGPQQSPGRRTTSRTSSPIYCRTDSPIYGRTGSPLLHNSNTIFGKSVFNIWYCLDLRITLKFQF